MQNMSAFAMLKQLNDIIEATQGEIRSIDLVFFISDACTYPPEATQHNIEIACTQVASKLMVFPTAVVLAVTKVPGFT